MKPVKPSAIPALILAWTTTAFFLFFELVQLIRPGDFHGDSLLLLFSNPVLGAITCLLLILGQHSKTGYHGIRKLFWLAGLAPAVLYPILLINEIRLSWWLCLVVYLCLWAVAWVGLRLFEKQRKWLLSLWFAVSAGIIFYLYLDRIYYLFFKIHLNYMHLWRLQYTAVQDANLNLTNLLPYFIDVGAFALLSLLVVFLAQPVEGSIGKKKAVAAGLLQLVMMLLHFNFIVESRPFTEYLMTRYDAAGLDLPLPAKLQPLNQAGLVTSTFRLDPAIFYRNAQYSWVKDTKPNLIFITLESLRAHEIEVNMPLLMSWAKKGLFFKRHFSASNLTETAINSIYGSMYPFFLTRQFKSLNFWEFPAFLKKDGYSLFKVYSKWTGVDALYRDFTMIPVPDPTTEDPELTELPFEWFVDVSDQQLKLLATSGEDILKRVLEIAASQKRYFIEGYVFNAHFNYNYPPEFAINQPTLPERFMIHHLDPAPENMLMLKNRYKNAQAYVDHCLNKFLTEFYARGLNKNCFVIIYGDHGQSLGEAGFFAHVSGPHFFQFQVPLLILGPGVRPETFEKPSQHPDIVPTLGQLAGFDVKNSFGKNLFKEDRLVTIEQENSILNRFIVRRADFMSIYDITSDYRVRWAITIGNQFELTPGLQKIYSQPDLAELKAIISEDFALIARECRVEN
ncbi:MAG: LTA synthase family protein [Candidatus Rifleibacteriota bacterium]